MSLQKGGAQRNTRMETWGKGGFWNVHQKNTRNTKKTTPKERVELTKNWAVWNAKFEGHPIAEKGEGGAWGG